ncbi:MAG TPA: UDP-N-acetylmuramoyl-L-alanine--D-glutamate ligase [Candidatus Binatia bacterium]|jgi:UDP-N-acetylmuramoylalanine--D-glutamate ligase|nr:UDP-N-acetylmuramoyl-L-alanine--D-glutamate ligase [Candidatus Binatia bacterium]
MIEINGKNVLVIGLGGRGQAACELLCRLGAKVVGIDLADASELQAAVARLRALGAEVQLGQSALPQGRFDLAVLGPSVPLNSPVVRALQEAEVPLLSELELGFHQAKCLTIAIAGTNGKSTTAELLERVLTHHHRRTLFAGHRARPACAVADQTKELDYLLLQASSFQLATTRSFRPAVAVLLNLPQDHLERHASADDYVRAHAGLFRSQQNFDWAIVQSEALARLRELDLPVPGKVITFSAADTSAELHLERGLLLSRLPNWSGPLLDMDQCLLRGPHGAENLMAALAVGHALRLPLETMLDPLKTFTAGPHRFELVAELQGVQFINDSKARNIDALHKALLAVRPGPGGAANIWLIAGGSDQGLDYHDLGPILSKRVKRAFLLGQASEKIHAAWGLFTPCTLSNSLVEAVTEAASNATSGDVVLLSPASSSFDQFRNYQDRGERFCQVVKSISRGAQVGNPNMNDKTAQT